MNIFKKITESLTKTKDNLVQGMENVIKSFTKIDEELYEELEDIMIMSDIGVETSALIIENLRERVKQEKISDVELVKDIIKDEVTSILTNNTPLNIQSPTVILVVGVNGVGKTTTIGKLTYHFKNEGKKVILAAGDTFRAAAIDQLNIWATRNNVDIIKHKENSDPSAVIFDAISAAKSRNCDVLIADTAGRLHNKKNLMEELKKIKKVIDREFNEAKIEVLLVLDANTGQNALMQTIGFSEATDITGIVLTKLDSTAKGGIVVAIKHKFGIPIHFIGVGEGIEDLLPFNANEFSQALFETHK